MSKKFLLFSLLSLLGFGILTYLVKINLFNIIDYSVTIKIQSSLGHFWDLPFSILSVLGSFELTTLFWIILTLFILSKKLYLTVLTLPLFFIGLFTEVFGKLEIYHKQPPHQLYRGVIDLPFPSKFVSEVVTDNSYPSGHILRTTFLLTFLFIYVSKSNYKYKKLVQIFLIIFLILMVISRVYLGEHWISDIFGGLLLGFGLGLISVSSLYKYIKN